MQGKPHNITRHEPGQMDQPYPIDMYSDEYDTLLRNGMFRNREGIPISGSDADCTFDEDEIVECAKMIGMVPCPVDFAKSER